MFYLIHDFHFFQFIQHTSSIQCFMFILPTSNFNPSVSTVGLSCLLQIFVYLGCGLSTPDPIVLQERSYFWSCCFNWLGGQVCRQVFLFRLMLQFFFLQVCLTCDVKVIKNSNYLLKVTNIYFIFFGEKSNKYLLISYIFNRKCISFNINILL